MCYNEIEDNQHIVSSLTKCINLLKTLQIECPYLFDSHISDSFRVQSFRRTMFTGHFMSIYLNYYDDRDILIQSPNDYAYLFFKSETYIYKFLKFIYNNKEKHPIWML